MLEQLQACSALQKKLHSGAAEGKVFATVKVA